MLTWSPITLATKLNYTPKTANELTYVHITKAQNVSILQAHIFHIKPLKHIILLHVQCEDLLTRKLLLLAPVSMRLGLISHNIIKK
jgi:hypothetical protein